MITVTPIQKRFADVDMLGHVNNVNQQHYFDLGKSDYFTQVINGPTSWTKEGLIAVATNTNYMAQIWYNEPIVVRTRLEKIGNKSLTLFQPKPKRLNPKVDPYWLPLILSHNVPSLFRRIGEKNSQFNFNGCQDNPECARLCTE